jgi:hypothetical protein
MSFPQWKVLVVDEESRRLIDNVLREDDILHGNVTSELWRKVPGRIPLIAGRH